MVRSGLVVASLCVGAIAAFAQPAPAPAPVVSEAASAMVGAWEISDPSRERRCPLAFSIDAAPGGFKAEFDSACSTAFPSLAAVVAWSLGPNNVVRLVDGAGAVIVEFTEVESGMYESDRRADGLLFLQTQAALKVETRSAEQIFGEWQLLREVGQPLCRLNLSDTPEAEGGAAGSYRIVVQPGCIAAIAGLGLVSWRLDHDQLVLTGSKGALRFSESDATIWERVPLSTDPLLLVRQ